MRGDYAIGPVPDRRRYDQIEYGLLPKWEHHIVLGVRIIARSTLNGFVNNCVESRLRIGVKKHLDAWYAEAEKASWTDPAELKAQFRTDSIVSAERVVFNIKGNDYRLVVAINYHYQILLIIWLGTHKEYDKIDASTVAYVRERYANSSNSN